MNVHKNARSCPASRELLYKRVSEQGWSVQEASEAAGISGRRGREWVGRARRNEPLTDRSSRPHSSSRIAARFENMWSVCDGNGERCGRSQGWWASACRAWPGSAVQQA